MLPNYFSVNLGFVFLSWGHSESGKSGGGSSSGGLGFLDALALAFIVLKLTGFINWSWWWVTAPIWLNLALLGALALMGAGGYAGYRLFRIVKGML